MSAYNEWQDTRLSFCYNEAIFNANLSNLNDLSEVSLAESLCYFIPEVTKAKGQGMYPPKTLFQLIVAIQKHLNVNKILLKLIDGPQFDSMKTVLDNVMKLRMAMNLGTVKQQDNLISMSRNICYGNREF